MEKSMKIGLVTATIFVVVVVIGAAVIIPNLFNNEKQKPTPDHSLDTEESITFKFSYIWGWNDENWRDKTVFIHTNEHYDSDYDDDSLFPKHHVKVIEGTFPSGLELVVVHDDLLFWGYGWYLEGGSSLRGTWTGTVEYTVNDWSKYNGSIHTLHYTIIRTDVGEETARNFVENTFPNTYAVF